MVSNSCLMFSFSDLKLRSNVCLVVVSRFLIRAVSSVRLAYEACLVANSWLILMTSSSAIWLWPGRPCPHVAFESEGPSTSSVTHDEGLVPASASGEGLSLTGVSSCSASSTCIHVWFSNTPRLWMRSSHDSHNLTLPHCWHTTTASSTWHRSQTGASSSVALSSDLVSSGSEGAYELENGILSWPLLSRLGLWLWRLFFYACQVEPRLCLIASSLLDEWS